MRDFMAVAKALADENRTRIVMFLRGGELCVCQLIEMLGLAPSTVSKHLNILHQARMVESRKEGRWIYFRLPDADASPIVAAAIEWIQKSLAKNPVTVADAKRLKAVRKMSKDDLCCRYKQ